jgi:hypothetical protein
MAGISGRCLCGEVSYTSEAAPQMAAHCYCVDCRKSSGTGHCTHVVLEEASFSLNGEPRFYDRPTDSGNNVSRGFCPTCGSAVYSTNSSMPGMVFVRASSLDDPDTIQPAMSVYASRAPSWDPVNPDLPSFPEMPQGRP